MDEDGEQIGMMVYGYSKENAEAIQKVFESELDEEIILISATGKEKMVVSEILDLGPDIPHGENETKVIMLLGFDDEQTALVLKTFPKDIRRPIFCALTEENMNWHLDKLLEHLEEERKYWSTKKREGGWVG